MSFFKEKIQEMATATTRGYMEPREGIVLKINEEKDLMGNVLPPGSYVVQSSSRGRTFIHHRVFVSEQNKTSTKQVPKVGDRVMLAFRDGNPVEPEIIDWGDGDTFWKMVLSLPAKIQDYIREKWDEFKEGAKHSALPVKDKDKMAVLFYKEQMRNSGNFDMGEIYLDARA